MPAKAAKFLDSNAGAPLRLEVVTALSCLFNSQDHLIANPSSVHLFGRKSKRWMAEAREQIAATFGKRTDPEQLIFTSSGTEANQLAVRSILEPLLDSGAQPHWITTPVEHDSVLQLVKWLEMRGGSVSYLPVDSNGRPDSKSISVLIRKETALISMIWVNNETGVISDIKTAVESAHSSGIKIHIDAAQAWGKLLLDLNETGADYVSFSGHKIGALAGTGVLWVGRGAQIKPIILGKQEKGRRGGTENLSGIVAMGAAASALRVEEWDLKVRPLRDYLESVICTRIHVVKINGVNAPRVSNTTNLSFDEVEGEGLVHALDLSGYAVSAGSACSSGAIEPSHVLLAMKCSRKQAMASIRVSLGENIDRDDIDSFAITLSTIIERLRGAPKSHDAYLGALI